MTDCCGDNDYNGSGNILSYHSFIHMPQRNDRQFADSIFECIFY